MYNIQGPLKVAYGSGFNFGFFVWLCFVAVVRVYNDFLRDFLRDWWVL